VRKLYKEFMILGLISFAIFIISESYRFSEYSEWYVFLYYNLPHSLSSYCLRRWAGICHSSLRISCSSSSVSISLWRLCYW
jgi:hypothetical protein